MSSGCDDCGERAYSETERTLKKLYVSMLKKTADQLTFEELQQVVLMLQYDNDSLRNQLNQARNTNVEFMRDIVKLKFGK